MNYVVLELRLYNFDEIVFLIIAFMCLKCRHVHMYMCAETHMFLLVRISQVGMQVRKMLNVNMSSRMVVCGLRLSTCLYIRDLLLSE